MALSPKEHRKIEDWTMNHKKQVEPRKERTKIDKNEREEPSF